MHRKSKEMAIATQLLVFYFSIFSLFWCDVCSIQTHKAPPEIVSLVTGANKGIGKEIARRLGHHPNTITIIGCRDKVLGESACRELSQSGCKNISFHPLDIINDESITTLSSHIKETYGRLDVLINNAAICFNDSTLYGKVPHTPFKQQAAITINTNYFGTLRTTEAMLPLLQNSPSPRLINIASAAGRLSILKSPLLTTTVTSPTLQIDELSSLMTEFIHAVENETHAARGFPNTCYGMSKLGIIAMTRVMARVNPNVCATTVDPGYCRTDQNDNRGFVPPERGALTPFLLATLPQGRLGDVSGKYFFEEGEIDW